MVDKKPGLNQLISPLMAEPRSHAAHVTGCCLCLYLHPFWKFDSLFTTC